MKAVWNDAVIAEAPKEALIFIEGNWYFPPSSLKHDFLLPSETHTQCSWKGRASYYSIKVGDKTNVDAVWFYPDPMPTAFMLTKKDFTGFVAFWKGVDVVE